MEKIPETKPVKGEARPETVGKLEILDTHNEKWILTNKGKFLGPDFNKYLEELKEKGILKWLKSPGRLKFSKKLGEKTDFIRVVEPINGEGGYYYESEDSIHAGVHGEIFRSLPQLRETVIGTELHKHFEKLMSEPLKLLSNLEKKIKQEKSSARWPTDLLKKYARQLNKAVRENNSLDAEALIADLEDLGIEYPGEFDRDMFENAIVPKAEKHNLIEKTGDYEFTRDEVKKAKKEKHWVMNKAKWEEIQYQWWENSFGGILHIDVYTFKGDKDSDNSEKYIFEDLKQCAKMVGDIDWIKSSITKWEGPRRREGKTPEIQPRIERKKVKETIKKFMPEKPKTEEKIEEEGRERKKKRFSWDELSELKEHLEQ